MTKKSNAHTLIELIVILIILAALAVVAVPKLQFSTLYNKQADIVTRKLITDLRRTRTLAIANAATNQTGFKLQMTGTAPYSGYQIIDDSNGVVVDTQTIGSNINVIPLGLNYFRFGPLGNKTAGGIMILIYTGDRTYRIIFYSATGMMRCQRIK
ncbi:MAG: hypothetical protein PHY02_09380 [Phycisphaerae bacterium]|nr:hypothetical protein [Phycisphaerae bacterium]